jgi:hypothetical protein
MKPKSICLLNIAAVLLLPQCYFAQSQLYLAEKQGAYSFYNNLKSQEKNTVHLALM